MTNVLITVDEADTIIAGAWNVNGWDSASDQTKQAALDHAAKMIERRLSVPIEDVPEDTIKEAVALQAAFINEFAGTIKRVEKDGIDRYVSQDFGGVSTTRASGRFTVYQTYSPVVLDMLRSYMSSGVKMMRA